MRAGCHEGAVGVTGTSSLLSVRPPSARGSGANGAVAETSLSSNGRASVMSLSIMLLYALIEAVEPAGVARDDLLRAAQIDPGRLDDIDGRLDGDEYDRVQTAALDLTGDEALGLHMGERITIRPFDVLADLASHAPTLRDAFQTFTRFHRIVSDGPNSTLDEHNDVAVARYEFLRSSPRCNRMRAEFGLVGLLRMVRHFTHQEGTARAVYFEHPAPEYRAEYARIFGGRERFDHDFTGIEFDRELLDRTPLAQNGELYSVLESLAERKLSRVTREGGHAERLRNYLVMNAGAKRPQMDAVARSLGISVRSLRRRLDEEGVSYTGLLNESRATLAKRMLDDPRRSIYETAYAMGFSDPSAFHRAFKRWTGMTPTQYRHSL
jgi:AraC-like DNA-binding protein